MSARPVTMRLYRLVMSGLLPVLPSYLQKRARAGKEDMLRLQERRGLGYQPLALSEKRIWLHAVSVGESNAALSLANALSSYFPTADFIITTGTVTAAKMIEDNKGDLPITHIYAPFDAPAPVRRFLDHIKADMALFLESDFWPCLLEETHKKGIDIYFASAQMSQNAFQNWQKYKSLSRYLFQPVAYVFAVDTQQQKQFIELGASQSEAIGTLKLPATSKSDDGFVKQLRSAAARRMILLAASTHEGEEMRALRLSHALEAAGQEHMLIIAPRHPDRGDEIAERLGDVKRRSFGQMPEKGDKLYLSDSLGDMASLYKACDIVFLGATFSGKGGHNPLEAASFGKPIMCGPSQFKNQFEFDALLDLGVCAQISDERQMVSFIMNIMADKTERARLAKQAKAYVKQTEKRPTKVAQKIASFYSKTGLDKAKGTKPPRKRTSS